MLKDLLFELLNLVVSLIYLRRHALYLGARFVLVRLKVPDVFKRLLQVALFLLVLFLHAQNLALHCLDVVLFLEENRRNTRVDSTDERCQWRIVGVNLTYLLKCMEVLEDWGLLLA